MRKSMWSALGLVGLLAACGGGTAEDKTPIKLGLVAPKSGALQFVGESFERVALVAVDEINRQGGVNGHPLELIVKDDATDAATAAQRVSDVIAEGAVGAIGPATSGAVTASFPIARDHQFPIISPSSTAPSLISADDGGYMFRNVPNDNVQGVAMAYYLTQVASPTVTSAAIVYEDSPYGQGLSDSFAAAFAASGGTVVGRVKFTQNEPSTSATAATKAVDDLEALAPDMVVMVALEQDGLALVNEWSAQNISKPTDWFFTDGARSSGFLAGIPAVCNGTRGTAPTFPVLGDAYTQLKSAYEGVYDDKIDDQVFAPNVWDAVHLFAAALAVQDHAGEAFGGAGLRDRLNQVSKGPGVILHAGQWRDIMATIKSGSDIDYDGAAGPNDFDANGESVGPYEVWKIVDAASGGGYTFQQLLFLEAKDIQDLQGS